MNEIILDDKIEIFFFLNKTFLREICLRPRRSASLLWTIMVSVRGSHDQDAPQAQCTDLIMISV